MDEAQERFDLCLYPFPDLDLSGCVDQSLEGAANRICHADLGTVRVITKVVINQPVSAVQLDAWAGRLAHPYQLVFGSRVVDARLTAGRSRPAKTGGAERRLHSGSICARRNSPLADTDGDGQ